MYNSLRCISEQGNRRTARLQKRFLYFLKDNLVAHLAFQSETQIRFYSIKLLMYALATFFLQHLFVLETTSLYTKSGSLTLRPKSVTLSSVFFEFNYSLRDDMLFYGMSIIPIEIVSLTVLNFPSLQGSPMVA